MGSLTSCILDTLTLPHHSLFRHYQAIQVTDKWHLLKNLGEAVQRCLSHHLTVSRKQQTKVFGETVSALKSRRTPSLSLSPLQAHTMQLRLTRFSGTPKPSG